MYDRCLGGYLRTPLPICLILLLQSVAARVEEQQAIQALEANPMDPEAQRKIEEMIQKENIAKNMEMAMDEMPEVGR